MAKRTYIPPHLLMDKTPAELTELVDAGQISFSDKAVTLWRQCLPHTHADPVLKRFREWKKQSQESQSK